MSIYYCFHSIFSRLLFVLFFLNISSALAATTIPFTINMSEIVNVTGTPRIAVDVGGITRYATYASGTGTNTLTFNYAATIGDVDLDGVTLVSPMELNGGTITDTSGNNATLTFTVPNTSNVRVNYPSLGMDFVADTDGRYTLNGTAYNDLPSFLTATGGTFSRPSIGTYYDSTGTLQTAPSGTPRFDYDPVTLQPKGILIEESRTNFVKNSQFNGGAIGVSPNNFVVANGGPGVTASITNVGTVNGERFLEVRFTGTSTAAGTTFPNVFFTPILADLVPASSGQVWTGRIRIISESGTSPNPFQIQIAELSAGNAFLNSSNIVISGGNYQTLTRTLNNASTAFIRFIILTSLTNGQTVNKTIRFSVPQLEQGAFPTSYIPTTTGTITRAPDNLTMPTGSWFSSIEGTLSTQAIMPYVGGADFPRTMSLSDGSFTNHMILLVDDLGIDAKRAQINSGGTTIFDSSVSTYVPNSILRQGLAYQFNNSIASMDGALGALDTSVTVPPVNLLAVGSHSPSFPRYLNGTIQKIRYYPSRVSNTQLQLITQ